MATSTISNGTILQAKATGAALPPGTVLTAQGEPTTDPRRAEILLPLGGAKGSGLGLMFEMLASVLAAAPIQARALGPEKRKSLSQNIAILAIDVATFRPLADFADDADALSAIIKSLPRQDGLRRNPAARASAPNAPKPRAANRAFRSRQSCGRSLRRSQRRMRLRFRQPQPDEPVERSVVGEQIRRTAAIDDAAALQHERILRQRECNVGVLLDQDERC